MDANREQMGRVGWDMDRSKETWRRPLWEIVDGAGRSSEF